MRKIGDLNTKLELAILLRRQRDAAGANVRAPSILPQRYAPGPLLNNRNDTSQEPAPDRDSTLSADTWRRRLTVPESLIKGKLYPKVRTFHCALPQQFIFMNKISLAKSRLPHTSSSGSSLVGSIRIQPRTTYAIPSRPLPDTHTSLPAPLEEGPRPGPSLVSNSSGTSDRERPSQWPPLKTVPNPSSEKTVHGTEHRQGRKTRCDLCIKKNAACEAPKVGQGMACEGCRRHKAKCSFAVNGRSCGPRMRKNGEWPPMMQQVASSSRLSPSVDDDEDLYVA